MKSYGRLMAASTIFMVGSLSLVDVWAAGEAVASNSEIAPEKSLPAPEQSSKDYVAEWQRISRVVQECAGVLNPTSFNDEARNDLRSLVIGIKFVDVQKGSPIRALLPEAYYSLQGSEVVIEDRLLVVNKAGEASRYFLIVVVPEGIEFSVKYALEGIKKICVGGPSAVMTYETAAKRR